MNRDKDGKEYKIVALKETCPITNPDGSVSEYKWALHYSAFPIPIPLTDEQKEKIEKDFKQDK